MYKCTPPVTTRWKNEYKPGNEGGGGVGVVGGVGGGVVETRGGGGGGGGTHIAATVKNTVRRLLRRTKSHRDTPSAPPVNFPVNRNSTVAANSPNNPTMVNKNLTPRITPAINEPRVKRSEQQQQPPPSAPSHQQRIRGVRDNARNSRPRARLQVRLW